GGRRVRGFTRRAPQRTGIAGPGSRDPDLWRAPALELPPLAVRLLGARLHRHPLARLRRGGASGRARRLYAASSPLRWQMSPLVSRILVVLVLLPLVIGVVYLGGWWLFGIALVAGLIALHELYTLARELRPLLLAGYLGFVLALVGLELGGR